MDICSNVLFVPKRKDLQDVFRSIKWKCAILSYWDGTSQWGIVGTLYYTVCVYYCTIMIVSKNGQKR